MATKTVALDTEAHELLKRHKRGDESSSDAVKRIARPSRSITSFGGMWSDMTRKARRELDRVYSELREGDRRRTESIGKTWRHP